MSLKVYAHTYLLLPHSSMWSTDSIGGVLDTFGSQVSVPLSRDDKVGDVTRLDQRG